MKQLLSQLSQIWTGGTPAQRVLSVLSGLVVVLGVAGTVYITTRPDYALLFGNLEPADAASVVEEVRGAGVDAEVRDGGRAVYVPRQHVSEMRMQVSAAGLPRGSGAGWELFDNSSFGVSDFVQNVTYRRALQGELARCIASFDAVEKASVNITKPKRSAFVGNDQTPKASVIVHTRSGHKLGDENVRAIQNLISGAVEGLDSTDVRVMDSKGRVLTPGGEDSMAGSADTLLQYQLAQEDIRRRRVQELFDSKNIKADVRVAVEAELQTFRETSERVDATGPVLEEKTEATEVTPVTGGGGEEGTESQTTNGTGLALGDAEKTETTETHYGSPSRTVRSEEKNSPKITRLGVSLILHPDHQAQLAAIEQLVKTTVNFEEGRDTFSSMVHEFSLPEAEVPADEEGGSLLVPMLVERGVQVLGILGALFLVLRVLKTAERRSAPRPDRANRGEATERAPAPDLEEEQDESITPETVLSIQDVVRTTVASDPAAATRVLRTWLKSEDLN